MFKLLQTSSNCNIVNNDIRIVGFGVNLTDSSGCKIIKNILNWNAYPILLSNCYSTVINENNIVNALCFVYSSYSSGNSVHHNNVFNVSNPWPPPYTPCYELNSVSNYSNNYWDNYSYADSNGDGIGDIPHLVAEPNTFDLYPLIVPHGSFPIIWNEARYDCRITGNMTISKRSIDLEDKTKVIYFNLIGHGYCNLTIPRQLLDGSFRILIDDTQISWLSSWNTTHTSIYFECQVSDSHFVKIEAQVKLQGDINGDEKVDIKDIAIVAKNFGKTLENP